MDSSIIVALIVTLAPLVSLLVTYVIHMVAIHIPAQQRVYIEKWANIVVAMVEQQFPGSSNAEKKDHAMVAIKAFFKAFNLPIPDDTVLSAFIEAAVNALSKPEPPEPAPIAIRAAL